MIFITSYKPLKYTDFYMTLVRVWSFRLSKMLILLVDTLMFSTENIFYFEEYVVKSRALDLSEQMLTLPA